MSDPLRVALVAEGPTDSIVIQAALRAILADRPFVLRQLQPEGSLAFGTLGSGWSGVYRWCKQAVVRGGGRLSGDALLFARYDLLLLHVDADVAGMRYADASITPEPVDGMLPCELPCPPAADTADAVRAVLLSWCGESSGPSRTVLCVPSKSTEAWVIAALFPRDSAMRRLGECCPNPESRLAQQPKKARIRKRQVDYRDASRGIAGSWPRFATASLFAQAWRFQQEVLAAVAAT